MVKRKVEGHTAAQESAQVDVVCEQGMWRPVLYCLGRKATRLAVHATYIIPDAPWAFALPGAGEFHLGAMDIRSMSLLGKDSGCPPLGVLVKSA